MNRLQRAAVLTRLADQLRKNGSWCGETHLQKAAFLLQELLGVDTQFSFILYRHGPFSFDLRDELTALRADELLELEPQASPYRPRIAPTERAEYIQQRFPKTLKEVLPRLSFVADHLGDMGVSELERIATAFYVSRRAGSAQAVEARAARLRAVKPHVDEQEALEAVKQVDQIVASARERFPEASATA